MLVCVRESVCACGCGCQLAVLVLEEVEHVVNQQIKRPWDHCDLFERRQLVQISQKSARYAIDYVQSL